MVEKKRVLIIASQFVQSLKPLQSLTQQPEISLQVTYCSLPDTEISFQSEEYLNKEVFDRVLPEGYDWSCIRNYSPRPSLSSPWGLINPGVIPQVSKVDCCIVYGHAFVTFWMAIVTAKLLRKPLILSTDATYLTPLGTSGGWKIPLKRRILPLLYNQISDAVLVTSTAAKNFLESLGVTSDKIYVAPYVVDNDAIAAVAQATQCSQVRSSWAIPEDASVVVFCAKFIDRKRPQDLLEAFVKAAVPNSYLVMVGDGPLRKDLETQAKQNKISEKVRFLGFVKYSKLPEVYASSNLLVHPAEWEPYGLPVNEAMICGIPVIASDRVGAGYDLIEAGKTGYQYPCGNVETLTKLLKSALENPPLLKQMGKMAKDRVASWSSKENTASTVAAIKAVTAHRS